MKYDKDGFIATYRKYIHREGSEELLTWLLTTDFFEAPASTKYHSSYEGGLLHHSLNVFLRLAQCCDCEYGRINGAPLPDARKESIAICALLHDICKADFYRIDYKNQKVYAENGSKEENGRRFDWQSVSYYAVDDSLPYGHGEKSVYLIQKYMVLSDEEAMAIRWHMGDFSDLNTSKCYNLYPLAAQLHIADLQATYLDEAVSGEIK